MKRSVTPTQLRANLFQILDEVLATGEPCEITRAGRRLILLPAGPRRRNLDDLPQRECFVGPERELLSFSWDYDPDGGLIYKAKP